MVMIRRDNGRGGCSNDDVEVEVRIQRKTTR